MASPASETRAAAAQVSVIIPVHNGARYLAESLDSVLGQTRPPFEVVVVDDASSDGTPEILQRYGADIRVIHLAENAGPGGARNRALEEIQGDLVAFQDADDLWEPEKLELQVARFQARPELEMCVAHIKNFWMPEVAHEEALYQGRRFAEAVPGFTLPTLLARRPLFDRVGDFDPSLRTGSDTDWFMRARDLQPVTEVLPDVLVRRRLHGHNLTRPDYASRDTLLRIVKASLERRRRPKQ